MKTLYTLFYLCTQAKSLWCKLHKLLNSEILLQNMPHSAFFGAPDNNKNSEILYHLHLLFKFYLFKSRDARKTSIEGLKKNEIKIYNIEKQICFKDSKKETKFEKMADTRKSIQMDY